MHFKPSISVFNISTGGLLILTEKLKKCQTKSSTLSHLSESSKLFIKKEKIPLTGTVIELLSTLRFSVKHGGSVSVMLDSKRTVQAI